MTGLRVGIIGGGGNVAEATGAYLLSRGHQVVFYRFPLHVDIAGTPRRPRRSCDRLRNINVVAPPGIRDYAYSGRAQFVGIDELCCCDVIIIAMPAYMYEVLPQLLPGVFSGKIVVSLCERFLNSAVLLAGLRETCQLEPRLMISHRSEPVDAAKKSKDGDCMIWRFKEQSSVVVARGDQSEALRVMGELWGFADTAFSFSERLVDIAFQNLNALGHAVLDIRALRHGLFEVGKQHYTPHTYTVEVTDRVKAVSAESNAIAKIVTGLDYPDLATHEYKSYGGNGLKDCAGTPTFRYENRIVQYRFAPEWYRASGFEDVGWSLVPLESLGARLGLRVSSISSLIDEWNAFSRVDYRAVGRSLYSVLPCFPERIQYAIYQASPRTSWRPTITGLDGAQVRTAGLDW